MNYIGQVHIHDRSNTVIIDIPFRWDSGVTNSFGSCFEWLGIVFGYFRWSRAASSVSAASSFSLFFVVSVSPIIRGGFIFKTVGIHRIMGTFYFISCNTFVILFVTTLTFRFFTGRCTSADRRSLRSLGCCEIWVLSFRFWSRLRFFLSCYSPLISLVVTFACRNHSF